MSTGPLRILAYKPEPARQTVAMEQIVCCEPLELEWLDTYLEDHQVTLLDGMVDRRDPVAVAAGCDAQLVLISAFITNVNDVRALAARLKQLDQAPLVVVGGPHAEVLPEHFDHPDIDAVFFANQLEGVTELARRVQADEPLDGLPGAALRVDGVFQRIPGPAMDPSALKIPRRRIFEANPEHYFYMHYDRVASVKTAFGCHEQCSFCFCTEMHGGRYGPRPLDQVIEEIGGIPAEHIFILDDNFLSSRRRVEDFCDRVERAGFERRYIVYGDAAFIAANPDLLARFKAVGLICVIVGFESVDDDELADMNKRARLADNDRCVEICRELELDLFALFIADPDWQPAQFRKLARYVRERRVPFAMFSTKTLYPGTALARDRDFSSEDSWWRYDLLRLHQTPRHMSRLRYYLWLLYLYLVPSLVGATRRSLVRRLGVAGSLGLTLRALVVGAQLFYKLLRWR